MSPPAALARRIARRSLILRARDTTMSARRRTALVLAPHPDDETLGCGARILMARQAGLAVTVVVATDGGDSHDGTDADRRELCQLRSDELAVATRRLGLDHGDVIELGYPDGELSKHIAELADDLRQIIADRRPDEVYATCLDESHPDHSAAALAMRRAISGVSNAPRLLEYPIWLWADWPVSRRHRALGSWLRTAANGAVESVRVTPVAAAKQHALQAYASQLGGSEAAVALPTEVVRRALRGPELFFEVPAPGSRPAAGVEEQGTAHG